MKNKISTTIEQSKKLIELGIDVSIADFHWFNGVLMFHFDKEAKINYDKTKYEYIPAWSLNSLLNIIKNRKDCNKVELFSNYASKWVLKTTYYNSIWKEKEIIAEDSIDAAFEIIVWLKKNREICQLSTSLEKK